MTVSEILSLVIGEFGTRYQLTQPQALQLLNQVQEIAFDKDLDAFKVSDSFQTIITGSKGPYSFPTNPPVRKFLGVTLYGQDVIDRTAQPSQEIDYGLVISQTPVDSRAVFVTTHINIFSKNYTFAAVPSDVANTYRLVYYRKAPTIRGITDDANLLIPSQYHHTLCVQGTIALANFSLYGKPINRDEMEQYMAPFWDSLQGATDGNDCGYISQGSF